MSVTPYPISSPLVVVERGVRRTLCLIVTPDDRVSEWLTDEEIAALTSE